MIPLLLPNFSIHEEMDFKRWYNKPEQGSSRKCGIRIAECGIKTLKAGDFKKNPAFLIPPFRI
jgi:hypothetical protein